jgi:anti-anti-sigma factor
MRARGTGHDRTPCREPARRRAVHAGDDDDIVGRVDELSIELDDDGGALTLRLAGEVDLATVGVLAAHLDWAVEGFCGDVTLNLAGVSFLDSVAMKALLRAHFALAALGRRLVVADPAPVPLRVFELTGLRDVLVSSTAPG